MSNARPVKMLVTGTTCEPRNRLVAAPRGLVRRMVPSDPPAAFLGVLLEGDNPGSDPRHVVTVWMVDE